MHGATWCNRPAALCSVGLCSSAWLGSSHLREAKGSCARRGRVLKGTCWGAQAGFPVTVSGASWHTWRVATGLVCARAEPRCCDCFQLAETLFCGEIHKKKKKLCSEDKEQLQIWGKLRGSDQSGWWLPVKREVRKGPLVWVSLGHAENPWLSVVWSADSQEPTKRLPSFS